MRYLLLLLFVALIPSAAFAQGETVTVETILPAGSGIDDGLTIGPDGALYGSRWGPSVAMPGTTVTRVDLEDNSTALYATGLVNANGLGFDTDGNLFVVSWGSNKVERVTPEGVRTTYATAASGNLSGLLIHPATGVIYVTNASDDTVEIVESNGTLTPFLTNDGSPPELNGPVGLAVDDDGTLYVSNFSDGKILRVSDTGELTELADLDGPAFFTTGYITYAAGSLFATGIGTHVIEEVSLADGSVRVLAGTGVAGTTDGPGETAQFDSPNGILATPSGDTLYVSDLNTQAVRRIIRVRETANEPGAAPIATSRLLPVAPNPFAHATTIRVQVDVPQHITLTVYDALGRRVAMLANEEFPAGTHAVPFEAEALAAGSYLVRLHTATGSDHTSVTLTR